MSLEEIYSVTKDVESAREFLQIRGCLRFYPPSCAICQRPMLFRKQIKERMRWRCGSHRDFAICERKGSFWSGSSLSFPTVIRLAWAWALNLPINTAVTMFKVTSTTVSNWYSYFRDICISILSIYSIKIGGPGVVVQVDDSFKIKGKEGRVFAGYCPSTKEGFLVMMADRKDDSYLPLLMENVAPGSVIHCDSKMDIEGVSDLPVTPPYTHSTIRSNKFVDPVSGVHTNHLKSYWKKASGQLKKMTTSSNADLDNHIKEFMWKFKWGRSSTEAFNNLFIHIAELYTYK